ncbi:Trm112 family protein [Dokdonella sp. MW10]|uniref:Trm112 family protein n=1 Tax=Dokdonella sp. MW10 TaxID=2992926 RepID=UPI003F7F41E4
MDKRLLDILRCPHSGQPLHVLDRAGLDALNRAIAAGGVRAADGSALASSLSEALVTADHATIYRVDDGIPVLLADQRIDARALDAVAPA